MTAASPKSVSVTHSRQPMTGFDRVPADARFGEATGQLAVGRRPDGDPADQSVTNR